MSAPGILYIYYDLGQIAASTTVADMSANITDVVVDTVNSRKYAFVQATYNSNGTYQDEVDIRINSNPAVHKYFGWSAIIGYTNYSGPIWKDFVYTVPIQADRIQYLIKYNGNPIYKGWSYEIDGANEIVINEVCRDYLSTKFPTALNTWVQDYYAERDFDLLIGLSENDDPQSKVSQAHFTYDWSYDETWTSTPSESWIAMEPLQNFYDSRQFQLFSVNTTATLKDANNTTYINSNNARSTIKTQLPEGTATLSYGSYSRKFYIKDNCGIRYCLYYVNSRGGWDSVLVDGISLKTDKYERDTYTQNYRTPSINRGVVEYRNNITESWTLYFKALGDDKNALFHNLYESTNVYLHDLEEGRILPVIITSTDMPYKTRKNQGRKLYTYQINVESSQRKLRM
jgi:hypothetical protein